MVDDPPPTHAQGEGPRGGRGKRRCWRGRGEAGGWRGGGRRGAVGHRPFPRSVLWGGVEAEGGGSERGLNGWGGRDRRADRDLSCGGMMRVCGVGGGAWGSGAGARSRGLAGGQIFLCRRLAWNVAREGVCQPARAGGGGFWAWRWSVPFLLAPHAMEAWKPPERSPANQRLKMWSGEGGGKC